MLKVPNELGSSRIERGSTYCWMICMSSLAVATSVATPAASQVSPSTSVSDRTAPSTDGAATADDRIGDIVVTARRVSERLQDIPASVAAVSGDQVTRMTSLSDIQSLVSGVTFKNYGPIPIVGIRGYGNRSVAGTTNQSTVGIFQDGVFIAPPLVVLANRVDTERVEVAKGPQSTLYGRASFVGAINIVSNDPANILSGYVDAGYGGSSVHGENLWHIRGAVSAPLTDTLSVRFFGLREKRDGYIYDSVSGNRSLGFDRTIGRVRLLWKPSDDVTMRLTGTILRDNLPLGLVHSGRNPAPLGQNILLGNPRNPAVRTALEFGKTVWDGIYVQPVSSLTRGEQVTLDLRFKTPIGELASLTDYQHTRQLTNTTLDITRLNLARGSTPFEENRWSQELRLSNSLGSFKYLFGLYYLQSISDQAGGRAVDRLSPTSLFGPGSVQYDLSNVIYGYQPAHTKTEAMAAFGQLGYDFTDKLNLTIGLRQGHEELSGTTGAASETKTGVVIITTPIVFRRAKFDATTGSVNLSYKVASDVITYGSFTRGDSPGGLNVGGAALINYAPQKVNAFELGLKSQLFNRRLQLNVALFNNDYKQLQLTQNVLVNGLNTALITNAGAARGRGVDFDGAAVLSSNWRLGLQYTYADSKITKYSVPPPPAPQVNLIGIPLVRSPKHSLNGSVTFTHAIGSGKLSLTAEESYTSSYNNDYQGSPAGFAYPGIPGVLPPGVTTTQVLALFPTPGYAVTNLNASYSIGSWQLSGYVRNLLDKQYIVGVLGFSTVIYPQELPGEPRTFEVSLKYKF